MQWGSLVVKALDRNDSPHGYRVECVKVISGVHVHDIAKISNKGGIYLYSLTPVGTRSPKDAGRA